MLGYIRGAVQTLSDYSGLDLGSCKILSCLFLSFPFGAIFKRLPDTNIKLKNFYIIAVSAFYVFCVLELYSGFQVLLFNALFTYLITKYYHSRLMPWVNLVCLMLFLASNHIKAQFWITEYDPSVIDITGSQMVLVMKLSSFGFSYSDGRLYHKNPEKFNKFLNTYQKSRAVLKHPSFVSFMGYVFFYASLVTGPAFDYADYEKFVLTDIFNDVPDSKKPGRRRKRKIPKSGRVAALKVAQGIMWAAIWVLIKPKINLDYTFSSSYMAHNFIYRIFYLWILGFVHRLKYYAVWEISEAGCIVSGIGYNGYDPVKDKFFWNRVQNIDPYSFETGQNAHACLEAWNMNTNKWLKNFVYLRISARDTEGNYKPGFIPTFITFFTSAFWHGTKPGYYLTFVIGAFVQSVGKIFRRNLRPLFISKDGSNVSKFKVLYDIVCYFVTQLAFGYCVQPFMLLEWKTSLQLWKCVYFYIHVGCFLVIFLFDGPYGKLIKNYLKQYHLQPIKPTETETKLEPISLSQKLSSLQEQFDSTTDLLELLKEVPEFDAQEELNNNFVVSLPDLSEIEVNQDKLRKEINDFMQETNTGHFKQEEYENLKRAISEMERDIKYHTSKFQETSKKDN